ncbi:MAG: DUF2461 domain-containing protein [Cytophagales bacterium]|nr:MAG: DUF2461 domain-containing protein [Cytophagales bacterium]
MEELLSFLHDLKNNNNKEWFEAHKSAYLSIKKQHEAFVSSMLKELIKFDDSLADLTVKDLVFRIYRDVRFSSDKSPYKTHIGAYFAKGGKKSTAAGYYLHIEPEKSMLAGGAYQPPADYLHKIRQEIDYNSATLKKITESSDFRQFFNQIEGESLKTAPKGYAKDHPEIDLLRKKSFIVHHLISDKVLCSDNFLAHTLTVFKSMQPFIHFLNEAMEL